MLNKGSHGTFCTTEPVPTHKRLETHVALHAARRECVPAHGVAYVPPLGCATLFTPLSSATRPTCVRPRIGGPCPWIRSPRAAPARSRHAPPGVVCKLEPRWRVFLVIDKIKQGHPASRAPNKTHLVTTTHKKTRHTHAHIEKYRTTGAGVLFALRVHHHLSRARPQSESCSDSGTAHA